MLKNNFIKISTITLIIVAFIIVSFASIVGAHSFKTGDSVITNSGEKIDSTLFSAGRTISIGSEVDGDVFCAGQSVNISGKINGDVICAAQTITVSGEVTGDIRIAAQTLTLSSSVGGNITVAAETFIQGSDSTVSGDASVAGSNVTMSGDVERDLALAVSNATVEGKIGRNIKGTTENLTLADGAEVLGDVEYTSENELNKAETATVAGVINQIIPATKSSASIQVFGLALVWIFYLLLAGLVATVTLVLLFPALFVKVTTKAMPRPWKALLTGFVASIVMPFFLIFLLITVVGIPIAIILGLAWLVVVLLSGVFSAFLVGRWVMNRSNNPVIIMLVGTLVLFMVYLIPVIGFFATLGAFWIGTGMILLELRSKYEKPVYELKK